MKKFDIVTFSEGSKGSGLITPVSVDFTHTMSENAVFNRMDKAYSWFSHVVEEANEADIQLDVIKCSYGPLDILGSMKCEYPDGYFTDYWEIISEYLCKSLGVSYESRKIKFDEKVLKRENDAAAAISEGKERLASKISKRRIRPQNWKKIINTVQLGNCAIEFTAAINHFFKTRSRELGLDGVQWEWMSLCSNTDPLITYEEVASRLTDRRNIHSRNTDDRRRANNNMMFGMFTEGDDYDLKYKNILNPRTKKYYGDYLNEISGHRGTYIIRAENTEIESNLIIPTTSPSEKPIVYIREIFTGIKLKSVDIGYVFIFDSHNSQSSLSQNTILRSLIGLRKHSNLMARVPLKFTYHTISVLRLLSETFAICDLVYPTFGGSIYVCAMDFRRNISAAGERNINAYIEDNIEGAEQVFEITSVEDDFSDRVLTAYENILDMEAKKIRHIIDANDMHNIGFGQEITETMKNKSHQEMNEWLGKYSLEQLSINNRIILPKIIGTELYKFPI